MNNSIPRSRHHLPGPRKQTLAGGWPGGLFHLLLIVILAMGGAQVQAQYREWESNYEGAKRLTHEGDYEGAMNLAAKAAAEAQKVGGTNNPFYAMSLSELGVLYRITGKYSQAEALFLQAMKIQEDLNDKQHIDVADAFRNLAELRCDQAKYEEAETNFVRAVAIYEARYPQHPEFASCLYGLGNLLSAQGKYERAETEFKRAEDILKAALGPNHPNIAVIRNSLANVLLDQGYYERATSLAQRTLQTVEEVFGEGHVNTSASLMTMAEVFRHQKQYAQAEEWNKKALTILEKSFRPEHPRIGICLNNMGLTVHEQGDNTRAEQIFRRAVAIMEKSLGPNHPETAMCLAGLANVLAHGKDTTQAFQMFERALAVQKKALRPGHPNIAYTMNNLGLAYYEQELYDLAEPLLRGALESMEQNLRRDHPTLLVSRQNLVLLYREAGQEQKAANLEKQIGAVAGSATKSDPVIDPKADIIPQVVANLKLAGEVAALSGAQSNTTAEALVEQGDRAKATCQPREAIVPFLAALQREPKHQYARYQIACLLCLMEQDQLALGVLVELVRDGFWGYELMRQDTELEPLKEKPAFQALLPAVQQRYQAEAPKHSGRNHYQAPDRPPPPGGWPVLVFLHGMGDASESYVPLAEAAAEHGYYGVAVSGPVVLWENLYDWSLTDYASTKQHIDAALKTAAIRKNTNRERIYLCGFSRGAAQAFGLLANYPEQYAGAIVLSPGTPPALPDKLVAATNQHPLYLLAGAQEHASNLANVQHCSQVWQREKQPVWTQQHPGGHQFPEDWPARFPRILRWLENPAINRTKP